MTSDATVPGITTPSEGAPGPQAGSVAGSPDATAGAPTAPRPFPIVGIGASAGGLKALIGLLDALPAETGMAFVAIQHLDPSHDSQLPALLAKGSRLPVEEAVDGTEVRPDRVYVITPNTRIGIADGRLRISPREHAPGWHHPIDAFLRALAADRPGSAIGVILSGTGSDGTLGLAAIKAAGGITFAQDESAEYADMPRSAIGQGHVDYVLRPTEIAKELGKIAQFGFLRAQAPAADTCPAPTGLPDPANLAEDPERYAAIIALLRTATGIDFTHYRSTTIMRRTMRRMALASRTTLADYARHLADAPGEIEALARDILINVTSFYRDQAAYASLTSVVFPALMEHRTADAPIRLWVVGCSTGQEVYSLAIELMEYLRSIPTSPRVQIFATDISDWALAKARLGCYPEGIADEIPADRLARYFTREAAGFRVAKQIRDLCVFAKHDVTADTPFSRLDLISCRNVLIYLGPVLQRYVLPTFHFSLKPGGFLLLGTSESLGRASALYETIDEKNRLYRSVLSPGRLRPLTVPNARTGDPGMPHPPQPSAPPLSEMQRAADQIVLGRFAPAGVLVTEAMEIVQFRGRTAPYLEPAQGEASLNLLAMVPFGVAEALRGALDEARTADLPVRRDRVAHRRGESFREIAFEVIPIRLPSSSTGFLVLFEEQGQDARPALVEAAAPPPVEDGARADQRQSAQLRVELAAATDYVHSLVELNHALAEQLKDAQEEGQSSTEEFRSTNEELQTAKEEVESTNEELVTINEELRAANNGLATASSALRASGDLTAAIVETVRTPLLVLTANLRVDSANQAFLDAFAVSREETIGQLIYDLGDGQWDVPKLRLLLEDILPSDSAFDDFEVTSDFGRIGIRTMLLNARRLQGNDLRGGRIVLVIADVTDQRRIAGDLAKASAALQASGELTSAIVETMRSPLLVLAPDLSVESANQAFLDTFAVGRGETIGRRVYELGDGQWNIPELRRLLEDILPSDSAFDDFEVTHDFGAIGRRTMLLNARLLRGQGDLPRLIVLVIADITERTRVSRILADTADEQLRSNAELDQFAAVASHDLQEPLRMVSSFIHLLQTRYAPLFDERARGYMARVTDGAQHMGEMIGAILAYSQIGHGASGMAAIDSVDALGDALANLTVKIEQAQAAITAGPLPRVRADRQQLAQLFQNLLVNAIKFRSEQRPPAIRISAVESEAGWVFAVADNGVGMAEADHLRIFQPYQRANTDRSVPGFGIGLATCRKIVEHHHGRIWVESTLGAGSTFFFSLPR